LLPNDDAGQSFKSRCIAAQRRIAGLVVHATQMSALAPQNAHARAYVSVRFDNPRFIGALQLRNLD
jgi:hypothetical protein